MLEIIRQIAEMRARGEPLDSILALMLARFEAQAGTIHFLENGALQLAAHAGIPPQVLPAIEVVPVGKGMAGLAAERREPVQVCNLQTDDSGVAKPGARATQMEGSIAVPMLVDGELRGVLGIAKVVAHDWSESEKVELLEIARVIDQKPFPKCN